MDKFLGDLPEFRPDAADRSDADPVIRTGIDRFLELLENRHCDCRTPRLAGRWENRDGFHYHLHSEIFLQLQGGCLFRFPRQEIEMAAGEILVIPPGMPHLEKVNNSGGHPFLNLVLMSSDQLASIHLACAAGSDRERRPRIYRRRLLEEPAFHLALSKALSLLTDHRTGEGLEIRRELLHALLLRVRLDLRSLPPEPENAGCDASVCRLAQLAKGYLDENFPQHFPEVAEVAQAVGCSPNYLSGVFSRDYGITLKKYINDMRFDYAKAMLENSRFNVSEVAGSCGFNDVSYFSRQFRRRFGHYPSRRR